MLIVTGTYEDSETVLVIDDLQYFIGYDDTVAGSEAIFYPAGEVKPLLDHDLWILAEFFCCFNLL